MEGFGTEDGIGVANSYEITSELIGKMWPNTDGIAVFLASPCAPDSLPKGFFSRMLQSVMAYGFHHGHVGAISYSKRDNSALVHNICNPDTPHKPPISCTVELEEYFFSTSKIAWSRTEQFGIYNRSYAIYPLEALDGQVESIRSLFSQLESSKHAGFSLTPFHSTLWSIFNFFSEPTVQKGKGNCAEWVSLILAEVGILSKRLCFPATLVEDLVRRSKGIRSVHLERARHSEKHPQNTGFQLDDVPLRHGLLSWYLNSAYYRRNITLPRIDAQLQIEVPTGSLYAKATHLSSSEDVRSLYTRIDLVSLVVPICLAFVLVYLSSHLLIGLLIFTCLLAATFIPDPTLLFLDLAFIFISMWPVVALVQILPGSNLAVELILTLALWYKTVYSYVVGFR